MDLFSPPRPVRPARPVRTVDPTTGLDTSAELLLRAAREHVARAEALRHLAEQERTYRAAAALALHTVHGCSVADVARLLGTTRAEARTWLREGRRTELAAG